MTASGALATIGQSWRDELRKTTLTPNQLPAPDEDAGYAYFEQLKSKVIPGCIPGAVNAGSNEIVLARIIHERWPEGLAGVAQAFALL